MSTGKTIHNRVNKGVTLTVSFKFVCGMCRQLRIVGRKHLQNVGSIIIDAKPIRTNINRTLIYTPVVFLLFKNIILRLKLL